MDETSGKRAQRLNIAPAVVTLYALLGLLGLARHAMWRDEFNTWLIVRDSQSLGDMLSQVHYQGHTALWALLVAAVSQVVQRPWIMQGLHWAIAVAATAIFWRFSPFTARQKILFTFGYLPFYQYFLVSRPYVLGTACLFGICALFPRRHRGYWPLALLLALLANSHAYGLLVSLALALTLALEWGCDRTLRQQHGKTAPAWDIYLSVALVIAGVAAAVYILSPPANSTNHGGVSAWMLSFDLRHLLRATGRIFAGHFLVIPTHKRWLDLIVANLIAAGLVASTVVYLRRRPWALLFYSSANAIVLSFTYARFLGLGQRHFGQFYLILIAALWLGSCYPAAPGKRAVERSVARRYGWCLGLVLWVQCIGGIGAYATSLAIPLSASRAASDYIVSQGWQQEFMVASRDATMAPISGYLNRQLYYPERQTMGSFTLFNTDRQDVTHGEVLAQTQRLLTTATGPERILLVLSAPLAAETQVPLGLVIEPLRQFEKSWQENYYLYWAKLSSNS